MQSLMGSLHPFSQPPTVIVSCASVREKMPFHHVTAGLLYKGNYLSRSLSDSDSEVLASISVEELDGKTFQII